MTTLATMKTRIANEMARTDLDDEIAEAIASAILHYQWRRFWFNEDAIATSATVDGTEFYDPPATFLSVDYIKVTVGGAKILLDPTDNAEIERLSEGIATEGQPSRYSTFQGQYRLWPIPDQAYTLTWSGIIDRMPASDAEADNPWMTYAETLIRQRAKALVRIDVLKAPAALLEASQMAAGGEDFLTIIERASFRSLAQQTRKRTNTGRIKPANF